MWVCTLRNIRKKYVTGTVQTSRTSQKKYEFFFHNFKNTYIILLYI